MLSLPRTGGAVVRSLSRLQSFTACAVQQRNVSNKDHIFSSTSNVCVICDHLGEQCFR